jgi:hypothetical protein
MAFQRPETGLDPNRMRLRFHYEVDPLGKHIAIWTEEFEDGGTHRGRSLPEPTGSRAPVPTSVAVIQPYPQPV